MDRSIEIKSRMMKRDAILPRYAIYYSPDTKDALTLAANEWLGRDAMAGEDIKRASKISSLSDDAFDATMVNACRYGFHGTLKAPFELAKDKELAELEEEVEAFASRMDPFLLPNFVIGQLGPFFALQLEEPSLQLEGVAADIVRKFDHFRAPMSKEDFERRKPEKLSISQRRNLIDWGYPYIFEDFRFHMTLSDPIENGLADDYHTALKEHFGAHLKNPCKFTALSIFVEPERGAPFVLHRQFPLG